MRFPYTRLSQREQELSAEVREFLRQELPGGSAPGLGMASGRNPEFSRKLGERGWLGMALPRAYGGGERGLVDRFVVVEELLSAGAPVGYHWVADRQSGPTINRFGTPQQRELFLPAICRGEMSFAIGMSEPDSGSDLSSLRTAATQVEGGWSLTGTKVWTSGARTCDWLIVLARTSREERPQAGLTQFLVDRRDPAVTVRPIEFIDGTADFCEVTLAGVFVPDELVLGAVGNGWAQNTAELAFERGGPDRLLSTYGVFRDWLALGVDDPVAQEWLGAAVARYRVLRALSLSIARMADSGRSPVGEAALVKEMATRFEQDVVTAVSDHYGRTGSLTAASAFDRTLARAVVTAPSFTIRGGTNEILRTVIARDLARGDDKVHSGQSDPLLVDTATRLFAQDPVSWDRVAAAGLPWLSVPEEAGGSGGALTDALEVLFLAGRAAASLPLAETGPLGGWLLSLIGYALPSGPVTVIPGDSRDTVQLVGSRLRGQAYGVAWGQSAQAVVALLPDATGQLSVAVCAPEQYTVDSATNLADEPRDRVSFDDAAAVVAPVDLPAGALRQRGALTRVALIAGALDAASALTRTYTAQRIQFGRPIDRFQAVQQHLVTLAQQAALARMALDQAAASGTAFDVRVAGVIAAAAATEGARAAHQAHGAMGMTREYPLQRFTRRLWSWRQEYVSARDDARWLGAAANAVGADGLYGMIKDGADEREWSR
jgi:alkylation response protein AidB-like acyl-CoA dehydrogenase